MFVITKANRNVCFWETRREMEMRDKHFIFSQIVAKRIEKTQEIKRKPKWNCMNRR